MGGNKKMETGGLCEDLVGEILDRVPINQVTRMKCLSKHWHSLISRYRISRPRTSSSMFLCQYKTKNHANQHQVLILNAREQQGGRGVIMRKAVDFSMDENASFMGSSNGLLLFSRYIGSFQLVAYVCNPAHKQWQWDTLPTLFLKRGGEMAFHICMGLAFDGVAGHPYKVIFCAGLAHDGSLEFEVYSSDTGEWRKDVQRVPQFVPYHVSLQVQGLRFLTPQLFFKGNMICIILGAGHYDHCMLVYNIHNNLFKHMRLPKKDGCPSAGGFLWVHEGILNCCRGFEHGFHVWEYVDDITEGVDGGDGSYFDRWKLKNTAGIVNLITQHPDVYGPIKDINLQIQDFEPCAFDEDLQIMYIQLPTTILSYSFETRRLEKIWTFEPQDMCEEYTCFRISLSIRFNGAYYPGGDSILSIPEALPTRVM